MKFGHHPNPAYDFCIEVDVIEGELADERAGLPARFDIRERIAVAMRYRVGGDARCIAAKEALRQMEVAREGVIEARRRARREREDAFDEAIGATRRARQ